MRDDPIVSDASSEAETKSDELGLLDLLIVLAKHKLAIIGLPLLAAIGAVIYSLSLPNVYTATTKLLPPQGNQSASALLAAQAGAVAGLGGLIGGKSPTELYVGMLRSRTVADNLVQRFDIQKVSGAKYASQAREALGAVTNIGIGRDGIITIEVDDYDPARAAAIANGYVEELFKLTQVLAVTEASQRRVFFEQQFARAKENLSKAETTARQALEQGGLIKVDEQGRAMIQTNARLRAEITAKEVQIGAMRAFAAERNPDLRMAEQELESMKRELAKMEGRGGASVADAPGGKGVANVRLLRELKYHETLYELLARQYEMARIDEAKDSAVVQVLDQAVPPDRKSKPARARIVLGATLAALIVAIAWALAREALARARKDARQAARVDALKRHMRWRSVGKSQ